MVKVMGTALLCDKLYNVINTAWLFVENEFYTIFCLFCLYSLLVGKGECAFYLAVER